MQPTLDIRRHADGSLDFDFYRRRAKRRRRLVKRMLVARFLAMGAGLAAAGASAMARLAMARSWQSNRLGLLARAGAAAAVLAAVAIQAWPQ
jgi:hypothetical protein